ncbi:MAG: hypothetical protein ACRDQZ_12435, partial [Mycobacteriales bacterium]
RKRDAGSPGPRSVRLHRSEASEDALMRKPLEEVSPIGINQTQRRERVNRNPPAGAAKAPFSLGAAG